MRRIAHLSDLHFGRTRQELLDPLVAAVNGLGADLVAISGDLTQRARNSQFAQARAFLDRIEAPILVVPGNHDVPLYNPMRRLVDPFRRYRRWIQADLAPIHRRDGLLVLGLNTVDRFAWQRGRIGEGAVARARRALGEAPAVEGETRVVVAHHPFEQAPEADKAPMRGAARAMAALADCGVRLVLSGHLHAWRAEPFLGPMRPGGAALLVQAGTGLSTRLRGEDNDFNLIAVEAGRVRIERHVARSDGSGFAAEPAVAFDLGPKGWIRHAGEA